MNERGLDNLHDSIEQWLAMADQKIIGRGREYYRNGHILSLELLADGSFEAEVEGSDDDYEVSVEVSQRTHKIVRCFCDCPYDYGDVCKHIAAVLMAIRDGKFQKQMPVSVATKEQDFREVILQADETHLRQFVLECAEQDEDFWNRLMAAFGSLPEDRTLEEIRQKLDKAVKKFKKDSSRYDSSPEYDFREAVEEILDSIGEYSRNGYPLLTFKAAVCTIQAVAEITDVELECSDDIYNLINSAESLLLENAEKVTEEGREREQREL